MTSVSPGYPDLARLMAHDHDIAIFRRFKKLNMLTMLKLQADILYLEKELEETMEEDAVEGRDYHACFKNLSESAGGVHSDQVEIMTRIKDRVKEYNEFLLQAHRLEELGAPSEDAKSVLREWLRDTKGGNCFLQSTETFTWQPQHDADFITLGERGRSGDVVTAWLSSALIKLHHVAWGHRATTGPTTIDPESGLVQYPNVWFTRVGKALTTIIASLLPVLAVLGLYFEKDLLKRIYIMIGMTAFLAAVLSLLTNAKRIEIFATVATFAAVEVVFIGSVPE